MVWWLTLLFSLMTVPVTLTFIQGTVVWESSVTFWLQNSQSVWLKLNSLPWPVGFVEAQTQIYFAWLIFMRWSLNKVILSIYVFFFLVFFLVLKFCLNTFNTGLHLGACELISCKLDMKIDTNELYSLRLVWMSLTFVQGHRVIRNLEHLWSFCDKWHDGAKTFIMTEHVKEITARISLVNIVTMDHLNICSTFLGSFILCYLHMTLLSK